MAPDLDAAYEDFTLGDGSKGITLSSPVIDLATDTFVTLEFAYFFLLRSHTQSKKASPRTDSLSVTYRNSL